MKKIDLTNYATVLQLRKKLYSLDMEMVITGTGAQKTVAIMGDNEETKREAMLLFAELRLRAKNDYEFFKWITEEPNEEVSAHEVNLPKPTYIHAYHSTHTFTFGGGFEIPYNINKGEAYDDDGSILAFVDPTKYRNKSQLVPALHSKTRAALRAKLIANGNHDAALHL